VVSRETTGTVPLDQINMLNIALFNPIMMYIRIFTFLCRIYNMDEVI